MVRCAPAPDGVMSLRDARSETIYGMAQGAPRTRAQTFLYWSAVLGVWGLIFLAGVFAVFATDLPDTSKIFDAKRQPSISYLDRSGALLAVRGSQFAPPV